MFQESSCTSLEKEEREMGSLKALLVCALTEGGSFLYVTNSMDAFNSSLWKVVLPVSALLVR